MPVFGKRSRARLEGVDSRLILLLERCLEAGLDLVVLEGLRTRERQDLLHREGKTRTLQSRHLTGDAVDIAMWPMHPDDWAQHSLPKWYYMQGFVQGVHSQMQRHGENKGVWTLRSGIDWDGIDNGLDLTNSLIDGPHIEIKREVK